MAEIPWSGVAQRDYCEGKTLPYLVPGIYEFFSFLGALYLMVTGFTGILQPHLEIIHKLLYASVTCGGIGSLMFHIEPINFNMFMSQFPLSFTLCFAILVVFEDCIEEYLEREGDDKKSGKDTADVGAFCCLSCLRGSKARITLYNTVLLFIGGLYFVSGAILIVFSAELFTFDVVEIYFAVPYLFITFFGLHYITAVKTTPEYDKEFTKLKWATTLSAWLAFVFRAVDAFACNYISVWFFPHPVFLFLQGYTFHTLIVFLSFSKATRHVRHKHPPEIKWLLLYPRVIFPQRRVMSVQTHA